MDPFVADFETEKLKYTRLSVPPKDVVGYGKDKIGALPADTFVRYRNGKVEVFLRAYMPVNGAVAWWQVTVKEGHHV